MNFIKEFEDMVLEQEKSTAKYSRSPVWAEDVIRQTGRVQNANDIKCIYISPVQYDELKDMWCAELRKDMFGNLPELSFRGIRILPSVAANDGPLLGVRLTCTY